MNESSRLLQFNDSTQMKNDKKNIVINFISILFRLFSNKIPIRMCDDLFSAQMSPNFIEYSMRCVSKEHILHIESTANFIQFTL